MLSGSGYADLGAPPALANLSSITVSAWYKPSGANDVRDLIVWDSGSFDYFKLSIKDSGTASLMGAWFSIQAATGEQKSVPFSKADWNPSVWYHLAGTFDDSSKLLRIYLNGALAGSVTLPGVQMKRGPWGTQRAYLGGEPGAGLRGAMDDVRVYNRALSSAEVNLLFGDAPHGQREDAVNQ